MATLAEIRAKLQHHHNKAAGNPAAVIMQFILTGMPQKAQLLQFDSFQTQIQTTLFSGLKEQ
jgi:hypothetical protein